MSVSAHHTPGIVAWRRRLEMDKEAVDRLVPAPLRGLHDTVLGRARAAEASGVILTGSTARSTRTEISDLDYHIVGEPFRVLDLSAELDLHVLSKAELEADILAGDDFIQWSLRFGRIVFDDGVLLAASQLVARRGWPDVESKKRHAGKSLALAARVVDSGDEDGALLQVRTALSLAARAYLLSSGVFPLSRAELPEQLAAAGQSTVGDALRACIWAEPSLEQLQSAVRLGSELLQDTDDPRLSGAGRHGTEA